MHKADFSYRTIERPSEGLYKDKGSRFLSFAYPVRSEDEVKDRVSVLERKYHDARHHCFAWMLGVEKKAWRAFDDGEPNHSAGDPILGQIRSRDLTNVLVVVVRYFGGVKLGVGGLVTAYRTAAEDALSHAVVVERELTHSITIVYDYSATPEVMRLIRDFDLRPGSQKFEGDCELMAEYKMRDKERLLERLVLIKAMGGKIRYDNA